MNALTQNASIQSARFQVAIDKFVQTNAPLMQPAPDRYVPRRQDFAVVADLIRKTIEGNLPGDYAVSEDDCELEAFAEHLLDEPTTGLYVVDATACPEAIECLSTKAYRCTGEQDLELRMDQLAVALPAATDGRVLAVYYCKVIGA